MTRGDLDELEMRPFLEYYDFEITSADFKLSFYP